MQYERPFSIFTDNGQVKNGLRSTELLPPSKRLHTQRHYRFILIFLIKLQWKMDIAIF